MNKAVLISIRPKWCELIASGKKTIEVRKTRPNLETPYKCYIYCTKSRALQFWINPRYSYADDHSHNQFDRCGSGKVIGEFVCDSISEIINVGNAFKVGKTASETNRVARASCLDFGDMHDYLGHKGGYGWHISNLIIYNMPKQLREFKASRTKHVTEKAFFQEGVCDEIRHVRVLEPLSLPPQSWCYVEPQRLEILQF